MIKVNYKKQIAVIVTVAMLVATSPMGSVMAQTNSTPPPTPTAPPKPTPPSTPTPPPVHNNNNSDNSTPESPLPSSESKPTVSSGGESQNGQQGDSSINTSDANANGSLINIANQNASGGTGVATTTSGPSVSVANEANGANSENNGSVNVVNDSNTTQTNNADVNNNMDISTSTGGNSASFNTGGDNVIVTGNANSTGTIINFLNSNLAGVSVYEFNIMDNQSGDYVLDFSKGTCVYGCVGTVDISNEGNGANSENTGSVQVTNNNDTTQVNNANLNNTMVLTANSGYNDTSFNTGGDNVIITGDANVAANVLNFTNTNVEGGVIYAVVNVFGDLIGNIIFPSSMCCTADTTVKNTGNGTNSDNTTEANIENNNNITQFNNADIDNTLVIDATTGNNNASFNTGGNSTVVTGDTNVEASVVNFGNMNFVSGDWFLVLVNEAGKWIGKIMGFDGSVASSEDLEFDVSESGDVKLVNSGNGAGSTNTGEANIENNNYITQVNNANVGNNLQLSANTGGNDANYNTGGNSTIKTGDANIVANIVNFVNTNITGGGRLFVNVINVFGSWIGDFVQGEANNNSDKGNNSTDKAIGGNTSNSHTESQSSFVNDTSVSLDAEGDYLAVINTLSTDDTNNKKSEKNYLSAVSNLNVDNDPGDKLALAGESDSKPSVLGTQSDKKKVTINLALPFTFIVLAGAYYGLDKLKKVLVGVKS